LLLPSHADAFRYDRIMTSLPPYGIPPPGYRLPDQTHVGRVRLQVADLQRSLDYYERVIGLEVHARSETIAALGPHDEHPVLVELQEKQGVAAAPRRGAYGLYHFAILLPSREDLGRFVAHLASLGIRFGAADHRVSEAIYLGDPDGLGIEVYADRPRTEWQVRGRELAMSTDPLNLQALVAASGDASWTGAPAGTVIGHVHLHVGDLDAGERFYHAALGLDKVVWGYPGALFLSAGGYHHHLGTNTWSPGPAATDDQARLLDWELRVPNADAAAASLRRAGFDVDDTGDGWISADPWGTRVKITNC
jgi:catechol 2,3-dioxygenase